MYRPDLRGITMDTTHAIKSVSKLVTEPAMPATPAPTAPEAQPITVYVTIGNSDDKLTQAEWASYFRDVALNLRAYANTVHGQWVAEPASAWQNACWCVTIPVQKIGHVQATLAQIAAEYRQNSIVWAEARPEFITADGAS